MHGPRVAPPSRRLGRSALGGRGGLKALTNSLPSERELGRISTCAETLTASSSVKATVNINIVKRDERLNQAMITLLSD